MATTARFYITDYDGQTHEFYRFLDGYPCDNGGVFANFPLGDHDFCLDTYIRRLELEKSQKKYLTDVSYKMDLKTRTVEVSGCCEDFNFKGTFEEAIRHYAYKNYSEKDALSNFPKKSDVESFLSCGLIDGFWEIIRAIRRNVPQLEYDFLEHRIIEIGDNLRFYLSQDFIHYPSCEMNQNYKARVDAMLNTRRIGFITYFKNTISQKRFTFNYMIRLTKDGYILPLTEEYIPYTEGISDEVKNLEMEMIIEMIKGVDFKTASAQNFLYGIHSDSELQKIRKAIEEKKS